MNRTISESTTHNIIIPAQRAVWKYVGSLTPVVVLWVILVGWLASTLFDRAQWSDKTDEATIREWLDETRIFRKTLPELVAEYVKLRDDELQAPSVSRRHATKRSEIAEHMYAITEPTRAYTNQLPIFPEIFRLEVELVNAGDSASKSDFISWVSSVPRPARLSRGQLRELRYQPLGETDTRAYISCEYRLHAFNKLQRREEERRQTSVVAGALLLTATVLVALFVYRFLRRERAREVARLTAMSEKEHRERELLESRLAHEESEKAKQELNARLLQQQLTTSDLQRRAAEAEKTTLEVKSQIYASIGIMAGSYAHNIKNLLVRPNDLLARCIEVNGLSHEQEGMISEVRSTLGTVTERLQQILRTVRRDPTQAEKTRLNLNSMVMESFNTWTEMGRDKWKIRIVNEIASEALWIQGDPSHLQQAIENLLFNARDATFEMRNALREQARQSDSAARKQRIIEAAAWKGEVVLKTYAQDNKVILEVRDNGIGMTEEVRNNCMRTYFTTKRDNALYEGYNAGMGLGLSFVAMVLEHHNAELHIASRPQQGATFQIGFPMAQPPS